MSGKILQSAATPPVSNSKIAKSVQKKDGPPPLPSRTPVRGKPVPPDPPPSTPPTSPLSSSSVKRCRCIDAECKHSYEDIGTNFEHRESDSHPYEQVVVRDESNGDMLSRLKKIEDNQTRLRNEFNEFRGDVTRDIRSMQASLNRVLEITDSVQDFMRDSLTRLDSSIEKMHFQILENSDHLGKQILDVRRDIQAATNGQSSPLRPTGGTLKKYTHSFDWEVGNFDSLFRSHKPASSQSYLIGQLDFKLLGGAVCNKDGHLHVKIYGEFTHKPATPWEKNCNFDCSVYIVDKSRRKSDFLMGKVRGDFNSDKEWIVGDVSVSEVKEMGYTARDGNLNLKFAIEVYAA